MEENGNRKEGILSNWIVKNIILAVLFVAALVIAATILLNVITHHGQSIEVPDLTSMTVEDAKHEAAKSDLRVEVIDSIFVKRMEKGAVYGQNPKPGVRVKKGRRILLTINAKNTKKVTMPNLVGLSMRQAKAELSSRGLALGKLIYVSDIATNNVLHQIYHNRQIRPGRQIDAGSEIDLEVGLNESDCHTAIPDVKGLKYLRAIDAIQDNSLNIRKVSFDASVKTYSDSINAVVYRQNPGPSSSVTMGSEVSIYLSMDKKDTDKE